MFTSFLRYAHSRDRCSCSLLLTVSPTLAFRLLHRLFFPAADLAVHLRHPEQGSSARLRNVSHLSTLLFCIMKFWAALLYALGFLATAGMALQCRTRRVSRRSSLVSAGMRPRPWIVVLLHISRTFRVSYVWTASGERERCIVNAIVYFFLIRYIIIITVMSDCFFVLIIFVFLISSSCCFTYPLVFSYPYYMNKKNSRRLNGQGRDRLKINL